MNADEAAKLLLVPDRQYPIVLFCVPIPSGGMAAQATVDFEDEKQRDGFLVEWRKSMAEFLGKAQESAVEKLILALADMFEQHCQVTGRLNPLPAGTMSDYCISSNENAAEILLDAGIIQEDRCGYYTFTEKYNEMLRRN